MRGRSCSRRVERYITSIDSIPMNRTPIPAGKEFELSRGLLQTTWLESEMGCRGPAKAMCMHEEFLSGTDRMGSPDEHPALAQVQTGPRDRSLFIVVRHWQAGEYPRFALPLLTI